MFSAPLIAFMMHLRRDAMPFLGTPAIEKGRALILGMRSLRMSMPALVDAHAHAKQCQVEIFDASGIRFAPDTIEHVAGRSSYGVMNIEKWRQYHTSGTTSACRGRSHQHFRADISLPSRFIVAIMSEDTPARIRLRPYR